MLEIDYTKMLHTMLDYMMVTAITHRIKILSFVVNLSAILIQADVFDR